MYILIAYFDTDAYIVFNEISDKRIDGEQLGIAVKIFQ